MRTCSVCGKEDKPWFEEAPCSCGIAEKHEEDPSPLKHAPECRCLGHEVIAYPVRMAESELTFDKKLGSYYAQRGWVLKRNGLRFYRVKILCRACMLIEDEKQERKRDYEKACREALGQETTTYAQMLAAQTLL